VEKACANQETDRGETESETIYLQLLKLCCEAKSWGKGTCVPPDFSLRTISNSEMKAHIVRCEGDTCGPNGAAG